MEFQRGQKSQLEKLGVGSRFEVGLRVAGPSGADVDVSCFGLDGAGKLSDEAYFVFYNQPRSPCGGVEIKSGGGFDKVFAVDLDRLPGKIEKLVFAATIDGAGSMSGLGKSEIAIEAGGRKMTFPFDGSLFGGEKAVMIAEVYKKGVWRVAAVGQGFNGGLGALLEHFGGEVADEPKAPAPAAPAPPPEPAKPEPTIKLGKVTLEKRGQSQKLSLKKKGDTVIHINLNWDQNQKKKSWWRGGGGDADLDLGCMFELITGHKGVIQPLGGQFGSKSDPPWILLDKDDRSGAATDGENMRLYQPSILKRVVIFAMIYEGSQNFTQVNGRVTVKDPDGNEITVHCDAPDPSLTFCAVCLIENTGDGMKITKEERYFRHHLDCDNHYGFGFRWTAGRK